MPKPILFLVSLALACLSACSDYSLSVNERTVYQPSQIFSDYRLDDPALRACVQQALVDQGATRASDLKDLNCNDAGIRTLAGLDVFDGLERLSLNNNLISEITPLYNIPSLRLLQLTNNRLQTVSSQFCTIGLKTISLFGNAGLDCRRLPALSDCGITLAAVPAHCESSP